MMPADPIVQKFKLGFTCCYLLKCSGGYLLIDTSYPNRFPQFQKCIARSGIDISEIKYLLLTHHHDDHAGFAAELVRASGCRIIAHRNALAPLKNGESMDVMKPVNVRIRIFFSLFALFHGKFTFPPVELGENDIVCSGDDSDLLKGIGVDGEILYTPGHTRDSISVVMADGTTLVGDAAMNFLPGSGIRHRPIFVENIDAVYQSWERLCARGAKVVFPAHGKPFPARELVPCR